MPNAEYQFCEPFHIDDGELDGLTPEKCFVLGVEYQMFSAMCQEARRYPGVPASRMIHVANEERCKKLAESKGLHCEVKWVNDDWKDIYVVRKEE